MKDRKGRIRLDMPDGTHLELDEETSAMVFRIAIAEKMGISPQEAIRVAFRNGYKRIMSVN